MNTINLNFDDMGKTELRAACKAAGVSYGKLNNDGMRAALKAAYATADEEQGIVRTESGPRPTALVLAPNNSAAAHLNDQRDGTPVAPAAPVAVPAVSPVTGKASKAGLKIEKDREMRNGVKRPSIGGTCRLIWDLLDSRVSVGSPVDAKVVKELAIANNLNPNNASIEFYQWRKFNGIKGRTK